ncbi:MAG: prepilin-type N-terminal cleavage/methylation domain-containing protein [Bacteriovoracaceae bacterium]|jgi:prepilin-type N-terminal cleavage/methylation domain-containing protein
MHFKQDGFSLIEVIVASTIMVGMALFMADMNTNMQKMGKDMEQRMEIIQQSKEIESFLSSQQICTDSLQGLSLDSTNIVIRLQNKDAFGNYDGTYTDRYSVDPSAQDLTKNFPRATLSHLEFQNIDLPDDGPGKFYIAYQFRKSEGSPFSKRYKVLIYGTAVEGKIASCFSTPEEVIKAVTENVCVSLGGLPIDGKCTQIDGASFKQGSIPVEALSTKGLLDSLGMDSGSSNTDFGEKPDSEEKKSKCPSYRVNSSYSSSSAMCRKICYSSCNGQTKNGIGQQCTIKLFSRLSQSSSSCSKDCDGSAYNIACK